MEIILASGSPRRRELLARIGVEEYRILVPDVDESAEPNTPPGALVEELSLRKAQAVRGQVGDEALVIAADTVVALEGKILGKPVDEVDAVEMLSALAGRNHEVYTGVTVLRGSKVVTCHEVTAVTFRPLSPEEIANYVATGEPMDKAGAYGIQGIGSVLVSGIEGDYFNVMGLPVHRLSLVLKTFGVDTLALAALRREAGKDRGV